MAVEDPSTCAHEDPPERFRNATHDEQSRHGAFNSNLSRWACAILMLHIAMLARGAILHSPTFCEAAHLSAGLSHWQLNRFELYRVNPPLVRMVAAFPILFLNAQTDWSTVYDGFGARPEFPTGQRFVELNGQRSFLLITISRWACIPFSALAAYVCWRWSTELYGEVAGLGAILLWSSWPEILAHGQLITPDMGATSLGVTASYMFWHWLRRPVWWKIIPVGILLGAAQLTKSCWLVMFGLWPLLWLFSQFEIRSTTTTLWFRINGACQLAMIMSIGLYVLNLAYGFEGTGTPLQNYVFISRSLTNSSISGAPGNRFEHSLLGSMPVPFPVSYLRGLDEQKEDFENPKWLSYLRGRIDSHGWWYFYLYGLLVKTPVGVLGLIALTRIRSHSRGFAETWLIDATLLAPLTLMLLLVSTQSGFSIHFRYVLPIIPFAVIWLSQVIPAALRRGRWTSALMATSLTWIVASSLSVFPHSLSYFNELAGGPLAGRFHMVYSALDWGQDIFYLKQWQKSHPTAEPFFLDCYTLFDPSIAGVKSTAIRLSKPTELGEANSNQPMPGWYAISATALQGIPCEVGLNAHTWFQHQDPVATAGYSIFIYHVKNDGESRIGR